MNKILAHAILATLFMIQTAEAQTSATPSATKQKTPFVWEGANLYFLLVDRFNNGNRSNDVNFARDRETGKLRGFEGGDIKGITQKIEEGYFDRLGINAIWLTPIVEQVHGFVDEGQGATYGFHGYWTKDWTKIDPNFGTDKDLKELVEVAHSHGIRVLLDAVINHTGPVTDKDQVWPQDWVRTGPQCDYKTFDSTTACTLVKNLPDILTESDAEVQLPQHLIDKWKAEGRYEQEIKELDEFFRKTGYPRAPRFYIIKWLTDYIRDFGIDGYRADTVKHTQEKVWGEFKSQCNIAFAEWKQKNPEKVLDSNDFFTVGEVYGYGISGGKDYNFGDRKVNYFDNGFNGLINFEFRWDAEKDYDFIFSKYSDKLNNTLEGFTVLNYLASHDDGNPFDNKRLKSQEAGTKLLLSPGISQVYYGDETARPLIIEGAQGDATLRSFMNWNEIPSNKDKADVLQHWQKLGKFRQKHPAIGAGVHTRISAKPYVFSRGIERDDLEDRVVVGLDLPMGPKRLKVSSVFKDNTQLRDAYSGKDVIVKFGEVTLDTPFSVVLLERK
ncbi:alpha-amylase family glycosyl hydrolase [Flavobacterium selenitireducens]|uniref:alpha-amylase family glycosyl hydrolase n=1 Tax=Flavobacterium selenitireducens TaxID=2722704 RepID=UPI00168B2E18|nr:alpha-amylase family glycosyl hydrolase [Flavobacterium selenitireducens]MBD3583111.1 alpha-amylase [Flavobacterium selenitireducens]